MTTFRLTRRPQVLPRRCHSTSRLVSLLSRSKGSGSVKGGVLSNHQFRLKYYLLEMSVWRLDPL